MSIQEIALMRLIRQCCGVRDIEQKEREPIVAINEHGLHDLAFKDLDDTPTGMIAGNADRLSKARERRQSRKRLMPSRYASSSAMSCCTIHVAASQRRTAWYASVV